MEKKIEIPQEVEKKTKEATLILKQAETFSIDTAQQCENASEMLVQIKRNYKSLDSDKKLITQPMDLALKNARAFFNEPLEVLLRAESILKGGLIRYKTVQRQKAEAEQAKLNEIARQKAEREQQKLERQAIKAEAKGQEEKAEELRSVKETILPIAPVAFSMPEKIKGQSFSKKWDWSITNIDLVPRDLMVIDSQQLNKIAKGGIQSAMKVPGIKFESKDQMSVRV